MARWVHVMMRSAAARELALALGAASAAGTAEVPPEPLDSASLLAAADKVNGAAVLRF